MAPSLVLINPWIYDFAAYDLWSKPLGLLYLAGYLRHSGFNIHLVDCLDVHHPGIKDEPSIKKPIRRLYGTGKYWRKEVRKPSALKHVPRTYSRYGISRKIFIQELNNIHDPAAILVTSLMTYWYPGVKEAISLVKTIHPGVPVILGGIYSKLCYDHAAQYSGADSVITDSNPIFLLKTLKYYGIDTPGPTPVSSNLPYPAFDLLSRIDYICLLTSTGCPYRCQYCASHFLNRRMVHRDPYEVLDEILYWHRDFGARDFAFYDDALLVAADTHIVILLEELERLHLDLRFHTPNAVHIKEITANIAGLMHNTGFSTIRLGLETSDFSPHRNLDNKVSEGDFQRAMLNLRNAGFTKNEIGVYILIGLPGQSLGSVIKTIDFVAGLGATPYLAEYSPIPNTNLWDKAIDSSEYDLSYEPLYHNNTLLPCWDEIRRKELPRLKKRILEIRQMHK